VRGSLRVFRAEGARLLQARLLFVAAAGVAGVSVLRVWGERVSLAAARNAAVQRALSRGAEAPPDAGPSNAWSPWIEGWSAGLTLGTLLMLVLASRSLAGDREAGLLPLATTRSVSRGGLVLGRALLGVPLVLGLLLITGLASWIAANAWFQFGPLVEHGYQILSADELSYETSRAALASVGPLLGLWAFGLAVSSFTTSSAVAVGLTLTGFLGFDLFKQVLGDGQRWVFASFAPSLVDSSAMEELTQVARGLSDAGFTQRLWAMNMILPWPQAALLLALAWVVTARRSL